VGAGDTVIDDNVPNNSIEWYTRNGHSHVLTGLLIREVQVAFAGGFQEEKKEKENLADFNDLETWA
jgi:hypothetical protein